MQRALMSKHEMYYLMPRRVVEVATLFLYLFFLLGGMASTSPNTKIYAIFFGVFSTIIFVRGRLKGVGIPKSVIYLNLGIVMLFIVWFFHEIYL